MAAADKQFALSLPPTDVWADTPDIDGCRPDAAALSWLTETGLLTRRLHELCGSRFNMQVLRDQSCSVSAGLHREVLLCCGEKPCIYAITDVPAATLTAHPWLAELGDEPLGESLQSRSDISPGMSRSSFSYALLDGGYISEVAHAPVWARRSEFHLGSGAICVTEVFLAGLSDCENESRQSE